MRADNDDGQGTTTREIDIALSVLDAVIPNGEGSYLAGPISTGRRYYETLAQHKVTDFTALLVALGEDRYLQEVRWPNVEEGERLASKLRQVGVRNLINTGPIFVRGWSGGDYMKFCLKLLEKKVRTVYFHPEWAYSNGAVKEFFFCRERKMELLTSEGSVIALADAQRSLLAARATLEALKLSTSRLDGYLSQVELLSKAEGVNRTQ